MQKRLNLYGLMLLMLKSTDLSFVPVPYGVEILFYNQFTKNQNK